MVIGMKHSIYLVLLIFVLITIGKTSVQLYRGRDIKVALRSLLRPFSSTRVRRFSIRFLSAVGDMEGLRSDQGRAEDPF